MCAAGRLDGDGVWLGVAPGLRVAVGDGVRVAVFESLKGTEEG